VKIKFAITVNWQREDGSITTMQLDTLDRGAWRGHQLTWDQHAHFAQSGVPALAGFVRKCMIVTGKQNNRADRPKEVRRLTIPRR
jgi:hypothetical protein